MNSLILKSIRKNRPMYGDSIESYVLVTSYNDTIRAYQKEIDWINDRLSSGWYQGNAYSFLIRRKAKLQRKILNTQSATLVRYKMIKECKEILIKP